MQRMIPVERLAREDRMVLVRARKAREIREEQNLDDRVMPFDEEALRARMHGIFCGEVQAMEAAGRTLFDFPDAPWEFQLDMARQVWDESRHAEIFEGLLAYMGAEPGDYVETEVLWRCTQAEDPAARVAGINRGLEGLACDVFEQMIRIAQKNGDEVIERAVDYVLADEITHVRMGSKWMRKLTEGNLPRRHSRTASTRSLTIAAAGAPARISLRTTTAWSRSHASPGYLRALPKKRFRDSWSRPAAVSLTNPDREIFPLRDVAS